MLDNRIDASPDTAAFQRGVSGTSHGQITTTLGVVATSGIL
jgi:hypothetical protein